MAKKVSPPSRRSGARRPARPRRLLLFVHYNKWGSLADYVVYLLKRVRKCYSRVVLISNSPLSEEARAPLAGLYDSFLQRENTGYDFLAWKEGLVQEGREGLAAYDSVTLMNDTCFGPLFDLEEIYGRMQDQGADFWGVTQHPTVPVGHQNLLATDGVIPAHVQSYFLCFERSALSSEAFHAFWDGVVEESKVENVIKKYETQLTGSLERAGLKSAVLCDPQKIRKEYPNQAILEPEMLLEQRAPFLKIKAFFAWKSPENTFLLSLLRRHSRYPRALIQDHLEHHFSPETSIQVMGHRLKGRKGHVEGSEKLRTALHIHAFYVDILRQMLDRVSRSIHAPVDLFLTTSSEDKAREIRTLLREDFPRLRVRELSVCENRGRDVWPWLQTAPRMADYDIAGHLHTKRSPNITARFSNLWREEVLDCLLGRFSQIQNAFARDPRLGIVIPDIPSRFRFPPFPYRYDSDSDMKRLLPKVWKRLGCRRPLDFAAMQMLVFPYGNMFWCRPEALAPMWQGSFGRDDIPEEPIPSHGTILHALERLPVYVAWEQGYDFRIALPTVTPPPGFLGELAVSDFRKEMAEAAAPQEAPPPPSPLQILRAKMRGRLAKKQA